MISSTSEKIQSKRGKYPVGRHPFNMDIARECGKQLQNRAFVGRKRQRASACRLPFMDSEYIYPDGGAV